MSIDAYYVRMSEDKLDRLISDSGKMQLLGSHGARDDGEDMSVYAERMLTLDNYWDSLHFLLTGSKFPTSPETETKDILSMAIVGGTPVGPRLSYGPARYLTVLQVGQIASAIEPLEFDFLASKYKPKELEDADLYKFSDFEEEMEALEEYFPQFKEFFLNAAEAKEAVLSYMT